MELLSEFQLTQHVSPNSPTHEHGNTLDLIVTKSNQSLKVMKVELGDFISDHCFVNATINAPKPDTTIKIIKYRKINKIDKDKFEDDLKNFVENGLTIDNLDDLVKYYNNSLAKILDKHAPEITKTIVIRPKMPWFDTEVLKPKRVVRQAERKWRASQTGKNRRYFRNIRNQYNKIVENSKVKHIKESVEKNKNNPKKLFGIVNNLVGRVNVNPYPEGTDEHLANEFADFFINKIETIWNKLNQSEKFIPTDKEDMSELSEFQLTDDEFVRKIIMKSKPTTCPSDPIPTKLIKENIDILLPIITKIVNLSLLTGTFSDEWKTAFVLPLLKKLGLELISKNYRPVSNLSFLSKVVEKSGLSQTTEFWDENDAIPDYLCAYRENYSTDCALIKLHHDILMNMEKNKVTIMIMIDLSAAFDTVDHDILLDVLQKRGGISGTVLKWYDTYLRPRNLITMVNDAHSTPRNLPFSVPQGSCAGPVLYNMYASTLEENFKNSPISILGYADDHAFHDSFHVNTENEVINRIECKLDEVKTWMSANRLKMNDGKTEIIFFGTKANLEKIETTEVRIGNDFITPSPFVKYLGAWLDNTLSMKKFISEKCKIAHLNIHNIKTIRKCIDETTCKTLMHTLVLSHLDYSNVILFGIPDSEIAKLYSIQKMAAKAILKLGYYDSATEALFKLHWLPIPYRIKHKLLCFVYKTLNDAAPNFLKELLKYRDTPYTTRAELNMELDVPFAKGPARKAFGVAGPDLWNTVPLDIRNASSYEIFKKKLKTHFFQDAFAAQIASHDK